MLKVVVCISLVKLESLSHLKPFDGESASLCYGMNSKYVCTGIFGKSLSHDLYLMGFFVAYAGT